MEGFYTAAAGAHTRETVIPDSHGLIETLPCHALYQCVGPRYERPQVLADHLTWMG